MDPTLANALKLRQEPRRDPHNPLAPQHWELPLKSDIAMIIKGIESASRQRVSKRGVGEERAKKGADAILSELQGLFAPNPPAAVTQKVRDNYGTGAYPDPVLFGANLIADMAGFEYGVDYLDLSWVRRSSRGAQGDAALDKTKLTYGDINEYPLTKFSLTGAIGSELAYQTGIDALAPDAEGSNFVLMGSSASEQAQIVEAARRVGNAVIGAYMGG